jgi:hypothetical protein
MHNTINAVPRDVLIHISSFLDGLSFINFVFTSYTIREIINAEAGDKLFYDAVLERKLHAKNNSWGRQRTYDWAKEGQFFNKKLKRQIERWKARRPKRTLIDAIPDIADLNI